MSREVNVTKEKDSEILWRLQFRLAMHVISSFLSILVSEYAYNLLRKQVTYGHELHIAMGDPDHHFSLRLWSHLM